MNIVKSDRVANQLVISIQDILLVYYATELLDGLCIEPLIREGLENKWLMKGSEAMDFYRLTWKGKEELRAVGEQKSLLDVFTEI